MYKAIIFDFFGVFCPDITLEWFKATVPDYQNSLPEFYSICTRSDYGKLNRADFFKEVSALAGVSVDEMVRGVEVRTIINKQLVDYVKSLREKNYMIACLSNGTHEWTLRVIVDHGLGDLFDKIVLSADLGIAKPNPEIYQRTLEMLNIKSDQAIFIDDRKVNTESAEKCGISSLIFRDTPTFINELDRLIS
jgi:putative hydrolase of the HAD superfamily